ncbi:MAG: hypothetical protein JXR07_09095 [Reichenbachiella sp.]
MERDIKNGRLKATLILLVLTLISQVGLSQKRVKYEDVLPDILKSEPASAIASIKSYLEDEPNENAGKFFQLGVIYHARFVSSNPLIQYDKAMSNIELSKEAFILARKYINEKEVNRNKEEYFNFGTYDDKGKLLIKYDSIIATMNECEKIQEAYEKNVPNIYQSFTQSFSHYSKASSIFSSIMGRYRTLKDLYLIYDNEMAKEFEEMKSNYFLFIRHFEDYKSRIDTFDIGYNQQLKFSNIDVYRLDGLNVEVNFLQDEIPIWNYGKWVDEIQTYVGSEIADLRTQMIQNEKLITSKLKRTEEDFKNNSYEQLAVDKEFLFTLRKFDLRSVIEPLFMYKEYKHALIHQEHWSDVIDADTTSEYDRKLASYGRMLHNIKRADTVLNEIIKRDVEGSYEKYNEFIDEYYQGMEGIKTYANGELATNQKDFAHYLEKLHALAKEKFNQEETKRELKFGKATIPDYLMKDESNSTVPYKLFTTSIVKNIDGSEYIGGVFFHKKESKKAAFICKKGSNGRIRWYKDFLLQSDSTGLDSHTELAVMYAAQTGCIFVLNGTQVESGKKFNVILAYNDEGHKIMQHNLSTTSYPRSIDFVQKTHSYMVTFKGEDRAHNFDDESSLYIDNINDKGESVWETVINVMGNATGVVVVEDGYIISGNYQSIETMDGKFVGTQQGESTFLIKLNDEGKVIRQLLLPKNIPYYTDIFFKTGDHAIHLFGSTNGHGRDHIEPNEHELVHFIVTRDLHLVSDSF